MMEMMMVVVVVGQVSVLLLITAAHNTHAAIGTQDTAWALFAAGRTCFADIVVARVPILILFFNTAS